MSEERKGKPYFETSAEFAEMIRRAAYESGDSEELVGYINDWISDVVADETAEARSKMQIEINRLESENAALEVEMRKKDSEIDWLNDELVEAQRKIDRLEIELDSAQRGEP